MMMSTEEVTREETEAFAGSDPAARSGPLECEIRPWYVAMARAT